MNHDIQSWCTWPQEWSLVQELDIGSRSNIALYDIGHLGTDTEQFLAHVKTTKPWAEAGLIFVVDRENVPALRQELEKDTRIHLWDSAVHDLARFNTYIPWQDWVNAADRELNLRTYLTDPLQSTPPYLFDCVMGIRRPHRDFLFDRIQSCPKLQSNVLVNYLGQGHTYMPGTHHDQMDQSGQKISPYMRFRSVNIMVDYAELIPYQIYNQAWFSLIVESRPSNDRLITEKLAKPLLANRVFVLFGAQHHLRDLKTLGYKTFAPVIDESYDEIEHCETRWAAAWKAALDLAQADPQETYAQLRSRILHNQARAAQTDWNLIMQTEMRSIANKYLREKLT